MNHRLVALPVIIIALLFAQNNKAISRGLVPGPHIIGADYGTCLYGTTRDSFIVVLNTGNTSDTIQRINSLGPDSAYFHAFTKDMIYINPTTGQHIQYPDTFFVINPVGNDSVIYPYRFYARKLKENIDSCLIEDNSQSNLVVPLIGNVVQPHLWVQDVHQVFDTVIVHDTVDITTRVGNSGTAFLTIDTIDLTGPDTDAWKILSIQDSLTGDTIPWRSSQPKMQPHDTWNVTLQFAPTYFGAFSANVHISGYDSLGRHANDSLSSFYNWGKFPYDTDVAITALALGYIGAVNQHGNDGTYPANILLSQNYPNPFSTATTFTFSAVENRDYRVDIYNDMGVRIVSLRASEVLPGKYSAAWNANGWSSGVYYYRVSAGENSNTSGAAKSFLLLR